MSLHVAGETRISERMVLMDPAIPCMIDRSGMRRHYRIADHAIQGLLRTEAVIDKREWLGAGEFCLEPGWLLFLTGVSCPEKLLPLKLIGIENWADISIGSHCGDKVYHAMETESNHKSKDCFYDSQEWEMQKMFWGKLSLEAWYDQTYWWAGQKRSHGVPQRQHRGPFRSDCEGRPEA